MIDVQNQHDKRNIPIQKVGVKDVEIPLKLQRKKCMIYIYKILKEKKRN